MPPRQHRPLRVVAIACAGALTGLSLAGCSLLSKGPDPVPVGASLAAGLAKADLTGLTLDGATTTEATTALTTSTAAISSLTHTVTVASVQKADGNDKQANVVLSWNWSVAPNASPPGAWTYTTPATLKLADDNVWHVQWAPAMIAPGLTAAEKIVVDRTEAKRADILGAGQAPLMTAKDVFQVGIDKGKLTDPAQAGPSAQALANVLGIDPAAFVQRVNGNGPKALVIALTLRTTDPLITGATAAISSIPGAVRIPATAVLAPSAGFARDLLGTVGPATADIVAKSDGTISATDTVGLSGLEQRYDAQLRGTPGLTIRAVGGTGAADRTFLRTDPVPGKPLVTSLDLDAQNAAQNAINALGANPGGIVVIRASTGEIVAAANSAGANGQSIATTARYATGSTMKLISSLALMRSGLSPSSPMPCTPTVTIDGRTFKNDQWYPASAIGNIPMSEALAQSCNTAYIGLASTVSQQDLADAGAALGVGVDLDLGFPAFLGSIPVPDQGKTDHAASMIGQARVTGSPLSQATVMASIIRGGVTRPHLVEGFPANPAAPAKPLTQAEVDGLRAIATAVVTSGTGRGLAAAGVTMAKTGTAEYAAGDATNTHAWMVAAKGDLAVAVVAQDGQTGAGVAGPVVAAFLNAWGG